MFLFAKILDNGYEGRSDPACWACGKVIVEQADDRDRGIYESSLSKIRVKSERYC